MKKSQEKKKQPKLKQVADNSEALFGPEEKPKLRLVKKKWTEEDIFPPDVTAVDETDLDAITDPKGKELADQWRKVSNEIRATRLPPRGILRLPEHLDERRLAWGIPHTAFKAQAQYDRILVFQIRDSNRETFLEGGKILAAPGAQKRSLEHRSSRAIIISAGLGAMDTLISHGSQIGDIIQFTRLSPFRQWYDNIAYEDQYLVTLHVGDITANEDLRRRLWKKEVFVKPVVNEKGETEHRFVDAKGTIWKPATPWVSSDY